MKVQMRPRPSKLERWTTRCFEISVLGAAALVLCGCAHQYTMKLSNGMQITTHGKPKLVGANYHYRGPKGADEIVPQSRVVEIEPVSMAKEEKKFKVSQPKKKHWYWPF